MHIQYRNSGSPIVRCTSLLLGCVTQAMPVCDLDPCTEVELEQSLQDDFQSEECPICPRVMSIDGGKVPCGTVFHHEASSAGTHALHMCVCGCASVSTS